MDTSTKKLPVSTHWMLDPNPYFFFRSFRERDLPVIARWMGAAGGLTEGMELRVLRQLKRQHRDPENAANRQSWMAVAGGARAFLLELTSTGEAYLTGPPGLHASPWRALEAWGYSIPYLFSEQGLRQVRIPLPDKRAAEIRALKRLGCRKEKEDFAEGVWIILSIFP